MISPALLAHFQQKAMTVAILFEIKKNNGQWVRATNHDKDLFVNGKRYNHKIPFKTSNIEKSTDLTKDNASVQLGIYGDFVKVSEVESGAFINAPFRIILVNWKNIDDGQLILHSGNVKSISYNSNNYYINLQTGGVTSKLNETKLRKLTKTCNAEFGDHRCGIKLFPWNTWEQGKIYIVGDRVMYGSNETNVPITNATFSDDGIVSGNINISGWSFASDCVFNTVDDGGVIVLKGETFNEGNLGYVYQKVTLPTFTPRDSMKFIVEAKSDDILKSERIKLQITLFNADGFEIGETESDWFLLKSEYDVFEVGLFLLPNAVSAQISFALRSNDGFLTAKVKRTKATIIDGTSTLTQYKLAKIFPTDGSNVLSPALHKLQANNDATVNIFNHDFSYDVPKSLTINELTGWDNSEFIAIAATHAGHTSPTSTNFVISEDTGVNPVNESISQSFEIEGRDVIVVETTALLPLNDSNSKLSLDVEYYTDLTTYASKETFDVTPTQQDVWEKVSKLAHVPDGATRARLVYYFKNNNGTKCDIAIDTVIAKIFYLNFGSEFDPVEARSLTAPDTFDIGTNALFWQLQPQVFGYFDIISPNALNDSVHIQLDNVLNKSITDMYNGLVIVISGPNAGQSFRIVGLDNVNSLVELSNKMLYPPQAGDVVYITYGCNKNIVTCVQRNNPINFRGVPFLPTEDELKELFTSVPTKVISTNPNNYIKPLPTA